jgi:aminoglycoside phosphotransferase (APT) family kinase protein
MDDTTRRYVAACWDISGLDVDLDAALRVWEEAIALPETGPGSEPRWYHGDLMAENLLVRGGRLAAVLDSGGLAVGDPTVDLIVAWEVLDPAARDVFRSAVGVDETSWLRGTGVGALVGPRDLSVLLEHHVGSMRQQARHGAGESSSQSVINRTVGEVLSVRPMLRVGMCETLHRGCGSH